MEKLKKLANGRGYALFKAVIFALLAAVNFQEYRRFLKAIEMDIGVTRQDAWGQLALAALCALAAALYLYDWWKKGKKTD